MKDDFDNKESTYKFAAAGQSELDQAAAEKIKLEERTQLLATRKSRDEKLATELAGLQTAYQGILDDEKTNKAE